MDVSVIIPTRGRVQQLAACLRGLVQQDYDTRRFEVLVGIDGADDGEIDAFTRIASGVLNGGVVQCGGGPATTRNALIKQASGRLLLLLNDDVEAEPSLVRLHVQAHAQLAGRRAMILGGAPWAVMQGDRLFDRLVRETSLVFFYDRMNDDDPQRDWGFRHAWTLNLSVPTDAVREVGGFCEGLDRPVYEDLELAWRLRQRFAMPVLYRPRAAVTHAHRYEPMQMLRRVKLLGHQAWKLAAVSPGCALDTFNVDVRSDEEVSFSRRFVERFHRDAQQQSAQFLHLANMPADAVGGPHAPSLIAMIYQQSQLLRRYLWRLGHLAAAEGRDVDEADGIAYHKHTEHSGASAACGP